MQEVDCTTSTRAFRMDDRTQRLVINRDQSDGLGFLGWEVARQADLQNVAARVEACGIKVKAASRGLADERFVSDLILFDDPAGNRLEIFFKPKISDSPFIPGRPISGFKTGAMGMGHVVLNVENVEVLLPFYRDVLGFRVTDFGLTPYPLYFFHLNDRHHSFAMVGSGQRSFHHFMVELCSLDDVGQGYDLAQLEEGRVAYTLGRHTNDHMTSFYAHSPSGFFVEYGWGGPRD
jgi:2,3-dihydroxybiphenyl 1,2-dioxygenase